MLRVYAGLAVAAVAGLLGYTAWRVYDLRAGDPFRDCRGGQVAGGAIGGPFTLTDQNGATVTDKDVLAKPALVYFGYTFCPDVCPLDAARNAAAADILEERGFDVTPVFITFDPKRDTPKVLKEFTEAMSPRMIGLTGTEAQTKAAEQAFKVYSKVQDPSQEYYLIDHSTFTYLMLPGTGFADFFKRDLSADDVADRVTCFMQKS